MQELWPYYGLSFLAGARSVLFKTLVLVQLVSKFGFSVGDVAIALAVGGVALSRRLGSIRHAIAIEESLTFRDLLILRL